MPNIARNSMPNNSQSDLAGVDIAAHGGDLLKLVCVVRDWLRTNQEVEEIIPDGEHIFGNRTRLIRVRGSVIKPQRRDL
jgi:hypothetical protein